MPRKSGGGRSASRDRSKSSKTKESRSEEHISKQTSTMKKRKSFDLDQWISENREELLTRLGISHLNLDQDLTSFILRRVTELLWSDEKKPDMERLSSRIRRNMESLRSIIAQMIVEGSKELSQDQLEYVISAGGSWILGYAPQLYRRARDMKRDDLILSLRYQWIKWWTSTRDQEIPPECPRCGFNSLMPDGSCIICDYTPTNTEILKYYHFDKYIEKLYERGDLESLKKILEKGFIIISSSGIKIPDHEKSKYDLEIHIPRIYREKIAELLRSSGRAG